MYRNFESELFKQFYKAIYRKAEKHQNRQKFSQLNGRSYKLPYKVEND